MRECGTGLLLFLEEGDGAAGGRRTGETPYVMGSQF